MSERTVGRALMVDALTWGTALPWMEGWWWVCDAFRNRPPEVVYVEAGPDGDFWTDDGLVAVDEMAAGTKWAGPIPLPTDSAVPNPEDGT